MRRRFGLAARWGNGMYWYWPLSWTLSFWEGVLGGEWTVAPLGPADLDAAASLHAAAFRQSWSGDEFASLLLQPGTFGFTVRRNGTGQPQGIVLARQASDEAEILTIAVDPAARGRGLGRLLMDNVLQHLHAERVAALFLEVEETNRAALALYRRLRFAEVGRRPAYYAGADGARTSALVLKRELGRL